MNFQLNKIELDARHSILTAALPTALPEAALDFEALWSLHPRRRHEIWVHHRLVKVPRWQQAYGMDYRFSGSLSRALPIPECLSPLLTWCRDAFEPQLNGVLLNWYDGKLGHYISAHRDSRQGLNPGSPIVTISLGQERVFRLRPYRGKGYIDIVAPDRSVIVIPYETNLAWTHEVPRFVRYKDRRISVTLRRFTKPI